MFDDILQIKKDLMGFDTKEEMIDHLVKKYEEYKNDYLIPSFSNFVDSILEEELEYIIEREETLETTAWQDNWIAGARELLVECKEEIVNGYERIEELEMVSTYMAKIIRETKKIIDPITFAGIEEECKEGLFYEEE